MDACEAYARQLAKKEDVELNTFRTDYVDRWSGKTQNQTAETFCQHQIRVLFLRDPDVARELSRLHENFVIVPVDKASNNYNFVCKRHYVDILIEELGLHLLPGNPTYNLTHFSASEVLDNHKSALTSFGIQSNSEELDLPYIS